MWSSPTKHIVDTKAWRCAWCTWHKIGGNCGTQVRDLARDVSKPTECTEFVLQRGCRFLLGSGRCIWPFHQLNAPTTLRGYSVTEWAGCFRTDGTTSCSTLFRGQHMVGLFSTTQNVVALSSGDSEYYGLVKTCSRLLETARSRVLWSHLLRARA